jgi:membrane protease YdiL (CAAX protease family)
LLLLVTAGVAAQGWSIYPGLLFTEIVLLLLPTLAACRRLELPAGPILGLRRPARGRWWPVLATGAGLGALAFAMAFCLTWPAIMLLLLLGGRHPGLPLPLAGPVDLVWALAVGALVAPVCEELLFRGFLQSSLRPFGLHAMVWATAVCFGLFHLDPLRFLPTLALGAVYGYLAAVYRSVYPSMVAHGTNNCAALVLGYLGGAGAEPPALTYEILEGEMIRRLSETGGSSGGLDPERMVLVGILASMAVMLAAGAALAVLVAYILRGLGRRAAMAEAEFGAGSPAVPTGTPAPGETAAAEGLEPGQEPPAVGGRPVAELFRNPWLGGIAAVAVVFWGLALRSYFAAGPGGTIPPGPSPEVGAVMVSRPSPLPAPSDGLPEPRVGSGSLTGPADAWPESGRGLLAGGFRGRQATRGRGRGQWGGVGNNAPEPKLLGIVRGEVTESWSLSVASIPASESVSLSPLYTR